MDSDIGDVGEREFELWCSRERIVATPPKKDKNGWDYNVEFPHDLYTENVFTLHQAPIECRVQVKSIIKRQNKKQINLKNLTLLAKSTLPAFILFMEYNEEQVLQQAYLLHIDFDWIKKILEKAAPIAVGETNKELHKTMMTVKYDESHQFSDLSGRGFANEVLRYINSNMDVYVQYKKTYLQQVGIENGEFKFSMQGQDTSSKLLDLHLGLIDEIDVEDFEVSFKRFGIDYLKDVLEKDKRKVISRTMSIDLDPQEILFSYREDGLSPWRSIEGLFYNTSLNQFFPEADRKVRLSFDYVDFILYLNAGKTEVNIHLEENDLLEVIKFRDLFQLFMLLAKTVNSIECQIQDKLTKQVMPLAIYGGKLNIDIEREITYLNDVVGVLNKFQIQRQVFLSRVMLYEQRKGILKLIHLPECDATNYSAILNLEKPIADMAGLWLHGYLAPLADFTLGYIFVIKGSIEQLDYKFTGKEIIEVRMIIIDDVVVDVPNKLHELLKNMRTKYSDDYSFMLSNISEEGYEDNLELQNHSE